MQGNPNPSPKDRFKRGNPGNPYGRTGKPTRGLALTKCPQVRPLSEVMNDPRSFKGSMPELLESVARDPDQLLETRLARGNSLLRYDVATTQPNGIDADEIWRKFEALLTRIRTTALQPPQPRLVEAETRARAGGEDSHRLTLQTPGFLAVIAGCCVLRKNW